MLSRTAVAFSLFLSICIQILHLTIKTKAYLRLGIGLKVTAVAADGI